MSGGVLANLIPVEMTPVPIGFVRMITSPGRAPAVADKGEPLELPALDIVALTSLNEGTPLTLIEAMANARFSSETMEFAQFAGILSHVPGGLGVFEAIVVLLLKPYMPAASIVGSLLAYRADVFHRGVDLTDPGAARFLLNVSFKSAGQDWIGYDSIQSRANSLEWGAFAEASTPKELALFGSSLGANIFMVGFAYQRGLLPVSADAINKAIELNGASVKMNQAAFRWGRRAVVDFKAVEKLIAPKIEKAQSTKVSETLDELVARRVEFLTQYQDAAWAAHYRKLVDEARAAEAQRTRSKLFLIRKISELCELAPLW